MSEHAHKLRIEHVEDEVVVILSARVAKDEDEPALLGKVDLHQCKRRADGTGDTFNNDRIILRREMIEPLARFLWAVLGKVPPGEERQV